MLNCRTSLRLSLKWMCPDNNSPLRLRDTSSTILWERLMSQGLLMNSSRMSRTEGELSGVQPLNRIRCQTLTIKASYTHYSKNILEIWRRIWDKEGLSASCRMWRASRSGQTKLKFPTSTPSISVSSSLKIRRSFLKCTLLMKECSN
jgi:hypothetical protein